jgi:hypothetical protein
VGALAVAVAPVIRWLVVGLVLVAGVVGYVEWRAATARGEMEDAFQTAIEEIHTQRAVVEREALALGAERAALKNAVAANKKALAALGGRSEAAGAATARAKAAAEALVAAPTYGALQGAATRLRVVIKPVVR